MKNKIIFTFVIFLIIIMFVSTFTSADGISSLGDLNSYKGNPQSTEKFESKVSLVLGTVQVVGIIISVVALIALGIKYLYGTVEERAEYKKTMIPYLIGAFMVFSITTIPQIVYNLVTNM